jgi:hypothetical protein
LDVRRELNPWVTGPTSISSTHFSKHSDDTGTTITFDSNADIPGEHAPDNLVLRFSTFEFPVVASTLAAGYPAIARPPVMSYLRSMCHPEDFPWHYFRTPKEPPLAPGFKRARWTCSCGQPMWDDYIELRPGAVQQLEDSLRHGNASTTTSETSFMSIGSVVSVMIQGIREAFRNDPKLPQHRQSTASSQPTNTPATSDAPNPPVYLLVSRKGGRFADRLLQISISDLGNDQKLFAALRRSLKRPRWKSLFAMLTLVDIHFVHLELHEEDLVDIRNKRSIPPEDRVKCGEYGYTPVPMDTIPPVGRNLLMHHFHKPHKPNDQRRVCLQRFPKKLQGKLALSVSDETARGWGIYLEEGLDDRKLWLMRFLVFGVGSLIFGVVWAVLQKSVQDAFTVSAWIVSLIAITTGFVRSLAKE